MPLRFNGNSPRSFGGLRTDQGLPQGPAPGWVGCNQGVGAHLAGSPGVFLFTLFVLNGGGGNGTFITPRNRQGCVLSDWR
jgi:hypothetical protein